MKKRIFVALVCLCLGLNMFAQDKVDVLNYNICLNVNNQIANSHIGYTEISFVLLEQNTNKVEFMLKDQQVDSVISRDGNSLQFSYNTPFVSIDLNNHQVGDTIKLKVYYHGSQVIENNSMAWGGIHYNPGLVYTLGVAFADYPHSYARSWFVVKDAFDDKATYNLAITVSSDQQAICGGVFDSVVDNTINKTYFYHIPQEISPYLVSMTIADFSVYTLEYNSSFGSTKPITVYYHKPSYESAINNMFANLPLALDTLEKAFGEFPFNRISYCVTQKGSMEHVDNISLAEGVLNNNISGMSNIVHELAHAWFGNLVTCKTAEDMWLNEGWTSFTTRLSLSAIYGEDKAKDYYRNTHETILKTLPKTEGYLPISGIDSTLTYGTTVYDKGSLVALSLKAYLGDSLFYPVVRQMLQDYSFKNISSIELRDYISEKTGIDMNPFFNSMVFSSSTPHYEIAKKEIADDELSLTILQRAYPDPTKTIEHSFLPLTIVGDSSYTTRIEFAGDSAVVNIPLNGNKVDNVFLDLNEDFQDLTTDYYLTTDSVNKRFDYPNVYFKLFTNEISSPVMVRTILHWIGESECELLEGIDRISSQHYWTVEGINIDNGQVQGSFYYNTNPSAFDSTLGLTNQNKDSLILLYRPDKYSPWTNASGQIANSSTGYLKTFGLWNGEYVMAMGDRNKVSLSNVKESAENVKIFPNPNDGVCTIECPDYKNVKASLYTIEGKFVKEITLKDKTTILNYKQEKGNTFIVKLFNSKTNTYSSKLLFKN